MAKYIETLAEFQDVLRDNPKVAVDFTAAWCGPCQRIRPVFDEFSEKYPNITFIKVDVDRSASNILVGGQWVRLTPPVLKLVEYLRSLVEEDIAKENGITAMPTFKFYHNGTETHELTGASEPKLLEAIEKLNCS